MQQGERLLGTILERHGVASGEALASLLEQRGERAKPLLELVVESKLASEIAVAQALAAECRLPFMDPIPVDEIPTEVATKLPISYARAHRLIVFAEHDDSVEIVCADPLDTDGIDDVRATFQKPVTAHVATSEAVIDAINRVYERQTALSELQATDQIQDDEQIDILDSDDDAPIIRWVNGLFSQAVKERAS
ncbi:MAG TPA: type II secretion system protein GspE, partial [Polyangiaceae bacterium]|nr:type II secretion system protein GspE [Polyangiaceae bacterium]